MCHVEHEYVAISEATKTVVWLRRVRSELDIPQRSTAVSEDETGAMKWATGHIAEEFRRSKHIEVLYHYVREQMTEGTVTVKKVPTKHMLGA